MVCFVTLSFEQFLEIAGDQQSLDLYREVPFPNYGYERLIGLFHQFCLIGGIPEVVDQFAKSRDINTLAGVYDRKLEELFSLISRVACSNKTRHRLNQIYQDSFPFAATRITYHRFSEDRFGSREVSSAFSILQELGLIHRLYPTTSTQLPWKVDHARSPRLQLPDTGLVNYYNGIQGALLDQQDLSAIFHRQLSLHVVAQELMATGIPGNPSLHFWVRDKTQSKAEVDFVTDYQGLMIPVEVKRGEPGRLRSLHQFIDRAPHRFAVRLYAGPLTVQESRTIAGKTYYLMSLPYFLGGKIREHLEGFIRFVGESS